jgi:hypothetical protein
MLLTFSPSRAIELERITTVLYDGRERVDGKAVLDVSKLAFARLTEVHGRATTLEFGRHRGKLVGA